MAPRAKKKAKRQRKELPLVATEPLKQRHPALVRKINARRQRRYQTLALYRKGVITVRGIAEQTGVSVFTAHADLQWVLRTLERNTDRMATEALRANIDRYMDIYRESIDAWERSKGRVIVKETSVTDAEMRTTTTRRRTETRCGETAFHITAMKALKRIEDLLGIAPAKQQDAAQTNVSVTIQMAEAMRSAPTEVLQGIVDARNRLREHLRAIEAN